MCLELADNSVRYTLGIAEDVPVKIGEHLVPVEELQWVEGYRIRGLARVEDGQRRGFHGELLTAALMEAMGGSSASWRRQGRRSAMWRKGVESEGTRSKRVGRVKGEGAGWSGARPALACGAALHRAASTRGARAGARRGGGVTW